MLTGGRTGKAEATGGTVQAPAQEITEGIGTTITLTTTTAAVEVGRVDGGVAETANGNETEKETITALIHVMEATRTPATTHPTAFPLPLVLPLMEDTRRLKTCPPTTHPPPPGWNPRRPSILSKVLARGVLEWEVVWTMTTALILTTRPWRRHLHLLPSHRPPSSQPLWPKPSALLISARTVPSEKNSGPNLNAIPARRPIRLGHLQPPRLPTPLSRHPLPPRLQPPCLTTSPLPQHPSLRHLHSVTPPRSQTPLMRACRSCTTAAAWTRVLRCC